MDGSAFCLRLGEGETGLFVNWLEVFGQEKSQQMNEVRRLCRLRLRPNGRFAEANVGAVIRRVDEELSSLRIVHDPLDAQDNFDADPSHAEIIGLPPGGSDHAILVGDLIAECVIAMYPATPAEKKRYEADN